MTTHDPEEDFTLELTVEVKSFGRNEHKTKLAYRVTKILSDQLGVDKVTVIDGGVRVKYDPVMDDGNPPPGYGAPNDGS